MRENRCDGQARAGTETAVSVSSDYVLNRCPELTYRQLDHWCRMGWVNGRTVAGVGSGYQRSFAADEASFVIDMAKLVAAGLRPAQASRYLVQSLSERGPVRLASGLMTVRASGVGDLLTTALEADTVVLQQLDGPQEKETH